MPLHLIDRIAVEDEGEGDAVVCVHGLGGSSNTWTPLMGALARHRVIRMDLPGSGRSQRVEGALSMPGWADAVQSAGLPGPLRAVPRDDRAVAACWARGRSLGEGARRSRIQARNLAAPPRRHCWR